MKTSSAPVWAFVLFLFLFPCPVKGEVSDDSPLTSRNITETPGQKHRTQTVFAENTPGDAHDSGAKKEPADSGEVVVEGINFKADNFGPEKVLIYLNRFYLPKIFAIEGKQPRIVVDLDNVISWQGKPVMDVDGIFVKKIRTHLHSTKKKLRIVLDLNPSRNYVADQSYFKNDNIFCITISAGTEKKAGADSEK